VLQKGEKRTQRSQKVRKVIICALAPTKVATSRGPRGRKNLY